jgi:hypothetical protein
MTEPKFHTTVRVSQEIRNKLSSRNITIQKCFDAGVEFFLGVDYGKALLRLKQDEIRVISEYLAQNEIQRLEMEKAEVEKKVREEERVKKLCVVCGIPCDERNSLKFKDQDRRVHLDCVKGHMELLRRCL